MFCTVYKLYRNGVKLPTLEAMTLSWQGDLRLVQKRPSGMPESKATLHDADGHVLLALCPADPRIIEGDSMLIVGKDDSLCFPKDRQTWLCKFGRETQKSATTPKDDGAKGP